MINQDDFRSALGKYVTGITIVTCNSKDGPIGITAVMPIGPSLLLQVTIVIPVTYFPKADLKSS